jgi:hypothetical protein
MYDSRTRLQRNPNPKHRFKISAKNVDSIVGAGWTTHPRQADFAGNFLGVFFGVIVLILFVGVVTLGCYNDYQRAQGNLP